MPSRNVVRNFYNSGYYHVYNRGVEKRLIFESKRDYLVFLYYLQFALSPKEEIDIKHPYYDYRRKNFFGTVTLFCYCLMPNHFHLFVRQESDNGISDFMKALSNAYTKYFNDKNQRVGSLFQGRYKAAHVNTEKHFLHLSRYIHLNPVGIHKDPYAYLYSSLRNYIEPQFKPPAWLNSDEILKSIGTTKEYREFMNLSLDSKAILDSSAID